MKVTVEVLTGALFYVDVAGDATVADLKNEIETQHEELPRDRLILMPGNNNGARLSLFNGCDDDEAGVRLADCGVQEGTHMYLFFKPVDDHALGSGNPPAGSSSPVTVKDL